MKVSDFDFDLPDQAIALRPASPRDSARLLQVSRTGKLSDHQVFDLPNLLRAGDLLVINETKVFPASLTAVRSARPVGGGGDVTISINLHQKVSDQTWWAFVKPAKRVRVGDVLHFSGDLKAIVEEKNDGGDVCLAFETENPDLMRHFQDIGATPLPPYIARQREVDEQDKQDYQTVYARETGSVAAPTAGLHFTPDLLQRLKSTGVAIAKVTLHVGAGTFLPVKTDDTDDHIMHEEWYSIDAQTAGMINDAKREGRRVIAVGTTSLRALESAAVNYRVQAQSASTGIFITPGYEFKIIDGLMTNFHLPKSTLFMLVSALSGTDTMQKAYAYAVETGYRFYSYGDSSLLWRQT